MESDDIVKQLSDAEIEDAEAFRRTKETAMLVIMFIDIVHSTALREKMGEIQFEALRQEKKHELTVIIEQGNNGKVIKDTGDGLLAVLAMPDVAVRHALTIQETLTSHPSFKVRIGLDMGQVTQESEQGIVKDVFGQHVNRAARLEALGEGGHILVSYTIWDSAKGWLKHLDHIHWKKHGSYRLEGILEAQVVYEPYNTRMTKPLTALCGEKVTLLPPARPYQNLIPKNYTEFIGREEELAKLMRFLSPEYGLNIITVDGIGGVGKTSLVLEVAYRCLQASREKESGGNALLPFQEGLKMGIPTFDAIIFTSAKQDALIAGGILPRHQAQRTLHDIFQEVLRTLDRPGIIKVAPKDQPKWVRDHLARQQTLLIVDNLETIEDKQGILAFLYELPANVKVVITTRERQSITPIRLTELPESQGLQLIRQKANEIEVKIDEEQAKELYRVTGGIPAAIIYAVGQISEGYTVHTILDRVRNATGDVARFCFQGSVEPLRGRSAHHLLMAIAIFPKSPVRDAIANVAGYATDPIVVEEELVRLQRLSLVTQTEGYYSLLPLTREYALAELATHPEFEQEARERWRTWYERFVHAYGKYEWQEEWHIQYDKLEQEWENIQEVLTWCAEQEQYIHFKDLWKVVERFTDLYGYWSDRLIWLDWLIQASERRGDLATLMDQLSDKGVMLQEMGQIEEATSLCDRAWKLHEYNNDVTDLIRMFKANADNRIYRKLYDEAFQWIERIEQIVDILPLEEEKKHEEISLIFRRARIFNDTKDYDQAEKLFQLVRTKSQAIGWQRSSIFAQISLANIKIIRGNFDQAENLLQTGLPIAKRNKDKKGVAFYKRSFARLAKKRGNIEEMHRWAREALNDFERLGMIHQADEMRGLLEGEAR